MSYGLAALSGLLSGLKGLPEGMNQGMQFDQRQQQIDEQVRHRQAMEQQSSSDVGQLFRMIGMPPPPGAQPGERMPRQDAHLLFQSGLAEQERQRKRQEQGQMSQALLEAGTSTGMAPGASLEMPQPGALMTPPAATPMPTMTQKTVDPNMAKLAKLVPMLSPDIAGSLIKDTVIPPKPQIVPPNSPGYLRGDKFTELPQPPAAPVPPGMVPKSFKQGGLTYETPGGGKSNLSQAVEDLLQASGIDPLKATPQQIDAAIAKVDARLDRRATLVGSSVKPADTSIIKEGAQQNELITLGQDLLNRFKTDPTVKPGGMARMGEMELPGGFRPSDVIGQQQTDAQRKWIADVSALLGTYRQVKSGLAVTNPEIEFSMPIVPKNAGAVTPQQIEALVDWGRRNKTEMDRALAAQNKRPMPPTSAPPTPAPPAAPKGEALSRRDPRYQKLRQRGLSDQQIQQQFGVSIGD